MTKKLLLADDSVTVQRVIELTFQDEGMQVVAVSDGRQAIDRLLGERPDVVLADVTMPERDGYDVAAYVKETPDLAHIPVVLMTGAFEQIAEARARAVGCDGVLAKPFEPHMAVALVRRLLAGDRPGLTVQADAPVPVAAAGVAAGYPFDGAPAATSLDDYFDRLDEALSSATSGNPEPAPRFDLPPSDHAYDVGEPEPPAAPAAWTGGAAQPPAGLADAFSSLLAEELGEAPAVPPTGVLAAPRAIASPPVSGAPAITDEFIEEVVRRVAERLSDHAVRDTIAGQVLSVAERLVREEIDRIKAQE